MVTDLNSLVVTLPVLEYHNRTFSWSGLLTQIRSDCRGHVYSAVIKGKLLGMNTGDQGNGESSIALAAITQATEDASPAALKAREAVLFGTEKEKAKMEKKMEKAEKKLERKLRDEARKEEKEKTKLAKPSSLLGGLRRVFNRSGLAEDPPQ